MFLNAVVLTLQEILEAALLISVMLVLVRVLKSLWPEIELRYTLWVWGAIGCGVLGAWAYALMMPVIAEWFDYVGQEVFNAAFQFLTILLLVVFCYGQAPAGTQPGIWRQRMTALCLILVITLAIMREGSEIILYMQGILGQPEAVTPVLLGNLVAAGIGVSSGVILFFALQALKPLHAFRIAVILLGLFAGNMAAQAVLLLTQADWLPYTMQVWDSSGLIPEYTVTGQLLYALVGYEATPSVLQLVSYIAAFLLLAISPLFRKAWTSTGENIHESP